MLKLVSKFGSAFLQRIKPKPISDWYKVTFDDRFIYRIVDAPGKEAWNDRFSWKDIEKVCFECTDYMHPDNIYFFVKNRPESYLIPSEAEGADDLWHYIVDNGFFDPNLAIKAMTSVKGIFCDPSE